jgi:hypothetical protein
MGENLPAETGGVGELTFARKQEFLPFCVSQQLRLARSKVELAGGQFLPGVEGPGDTIPGMNCRVGKYVVHLMGDYAADSPAEDAIAVARLGRSDGRLNVLPDGVALYVAKRENVAFGYTRKSERLAFKDRPKLVIENRSVGLAGALEIDDNKVAERFARSAVFHQAPVELKPRRSHDGGHFVFHARKSFRGRLIFKVHKNSDGRGFSGDQPHTRKNTAKQAASGYKDAEHAASQSRR